MRKAFYALTAISLFVLNATGQSLTPQVIGTTGGFAASGSNSFSFTTGEMSVQTLTASTAILTQGFQQPNDIYLAVQHVNSLPFAVQVYPNPTIDNVIVKIPVHNGAKKFTVQLADILGQVLTETSKSSVGELEINIPTQQYAAGTYLLNISDENKNTSTYKIIKVQ